MDVPSKTRIFLLPISFPFADIVLCAICRTLRRPQISCPGNAKIMWRGAGRASFFIDNYLVCVFWAFLNGVARLRQIAIGLLSGDLDPCK